MNEIYIDVVLLQQIITKYYKNYKMYMIWTAGKISKGMLCSPHHEIFNDISYHFKFNLNFQFRIPKFKTTSIVHLAMWPYQNYQ